MSITLSTYLVQGLIAGLVVACPVGPVSLLCVQRTIQKGLTSGFVSALGASTGDAIYALIGAFSLELLVETLLASSSKLNVIAGLLLCYVGISIFRKQPSLLPDNCWPSLPQEKIGRWQGSGQDFATILLLDTINPMTILPFIAIFSRLYDSGSGSTVLSATLFVMGVFLSGFLWRSLLSFCANHLGRHLKRIHLTLMNRVTGIVIIVFGFLAIYSAWFKNT